LAILEGDESSALTTRTSQTTYFHFEKILYGRCLTGLFPPWTPFPPQHQEPAGYGFVFAPERKNAPELLWTYGPGQQIDWNRLLVQWLVLAAITGANIVLLKNKPFP
jgi:hypothetical protein